MLTLIGSTTSNVSLFAAGLIIAAYKVRFTLEIVSSNCDQDDRTAAVCGGPGLALCREGTAVARIDPDVRDPEFRLRGSAGTALCRL